MVKKVLVLYSESYEKELDKIKKLPQIVYQIKEGNQVDFKKVKASGLTMNEAGSYSELHVFFDSISSVLHFIQVIEIVYLYFSDVDNEEKYKVMVERACKKSKGGKTVYYNFE